MVEFWFGKEDLAKCFDLVEDMTTRNIVLTSFLNNKMLEAIYKVTHVPQSRKRYTCTKEYLHSLYFLVQAAGVEVSLQTTAEDEIVEENITTSTSDMTD